MFETFSEFVYRSLDVLEQLVKRPKLFHVEVIILNVGFQNLISDGIFIYSFIQCLKRKEKKKKHYINI